MLELTCICPNSLLTNPVLWSRERSLVLAEPGRIGSKASLGGRPVPTEQSHQSFHRLFREHETAIREYCSRRLGVNEANDAAADVFVVAWRKISTMPQGDEALLWLYGVARNVVRNAERTHRRKFRLAAKLNSLAHEPGSGPEHITIRRAEDRMVLKAMAMLLPRDRELLRLKTWEELSRSDLATVLGISVEAVDMRVNRALKRMARALKAVGYLEHQSRTPRAAEEGGAR